MGFFKRKYQEAKEEVNSELENRALARRKQRESERAERLKQAEAAGKKRAQIEAQEKLRLFKQKQKSKSQPFKGFAGPTQKRNVGLGVADYLTGSGGGKKKKKKGFDMEMF